MTSLDDACRMTSLDDAWNWYLAVDGQLKLVRRIASNHWESLPWDGPLGRDRYFQTLTAGAVEAAADRGFKPLEDLAVFVLFSVFEAEVRGVALSGMKSEADRLQHPALRLAAKEARERVEDGSFFRVLEGFKAVVPADVVEQVNQVRKYQNWVAHGRRDERREEVVGPRAAYDRLKQFLATVSAADPSIPPNAPG